MSFHATCFAFVHTASDTAVAEEAVSDGDQLSDIEAEHVSAGHWDETEPAVDDDATSAHNEQLEGHDGKHMQTFNV